MLGLSGQRKIRGLEYKSMRQLREYQVQAIDSIRAAVRGGVRKMILQLPVGAGKTLLSASVVAGALDKGNKAAFVCPRIDLVDQTLGEFYKEGIVDVGVLQANHPLTRYGAPMQICSIQTLESRGYYPDAKVVFFDECHLSRSGHKKFIEAHPETIFIGLSATPWAKGLSDIYDSLIVGTTMKELMDQGFLSKYRLFAPNNPDLSGIKTVNGDYQSDQLSDRLRNDSGLVADIVKTWKEKYGKDRTLVFATDCAHAKVLQERFKQAGVDAGYQDAYTPQIERAEIKRAFHNRTLPVVVSVDTMIVGNDWDCRCISFCRSTKSDQLFVQAIGRGLRLAPPGADEKEHLILFDHSGTTGRLGFPEDIEAKYEGLLGGKSESPERKLALPKTCPRCALLRPPGIPVCPNCGFKAEVVIGTGIIEQDGELEEVVRGRITIGKKGRPKKEYTMAEKAKFLSELKAYGVQKQYKDGWALNKYQERFKVWPDWSIKDIPAAKYPSADTSMWIKSSQIRWAKSSKNPSSREPSNAVK